MGRKRWLWLAVLPLVALAAAHWGFRLLVEHGLATHFGRLSPGVVVEYGGLETALTGRVVLTSVRLTFRETPVSVTLPRLEIEGPSVAAYLLHNNPFTGFALPRHLKVRVPELVVPLTGLPDTPGDGCDLENGIPPQTLRAVGMSRLEGGFSARYRYQPALSTLSGEAALELYGVERLEVEVELQNVTEKGFRTGRFNTALLSALMVRLNLQPGFGRLLVRHCADRRQLTRPAFRARLAEGVLRRLQRLGLVATPEVQQAVSDFVRDWGVLEIDLVPPAPLALAFLPFVPVDRLVDRLGLELAVNGRPLRALKIRRPAWDEVDLETADTAPRLRMLRKQWRYRSVRPSRLGRYLGHKVRLQERGDPVRTGILVAVSDGRATVEQRMRGGKFVAYLDLDELVRAEVYLLAEVEKGQP